MPIATVDQSGIAEHLYDTAGRRKTTVVDTALRIRPRCGYRCPMMIEAQQRAKISKRGCRGIVPGGIEKPE